MRPLRSVVALAVASGVVLVGSPAASAQPTVPQIELGGDDGGAALVPMNVEGMYPGGPAAVLHLVLRRSENLLGGTFAASMTDVRDLERGCGRAETRHGDTSCGAGDDQGELSQQLVGVVSWSTDLDDCGSADVPARSARTFRLEDVVLQAPEALAQADAVCLSLGLSLPRSADNLVQSDLVRFDLRLALEGASPSIGVLDASLSADPSVLSVNGTTEDALAGVDPESARAAGVPVPSRALPFTGTAAEFVLWCALAALLFGSLLVGAAWRPSSRQG